jgi:hypothetical protein
MAMLMCVSDVARLTRGAQAYPSGGKWKFNSIGKPTFRRKTFSFSAQQEEFACAGTQGRAVRSPFPASGMVLRE